MNHHRPLLWLNLHGGLSLAAWMGLAAASYRIERPLVIFLAVMAWEWLLLLSAWRLVSRNPTARMFRATLGWSAAFFIGAFSAQPVMEDDQFRFLWDGRQFATTGNPYGAPPAAYFNDRGLPERFERILDQINYPHVPTIYGPVCQFGFLLSYVAAPGRLWPWKLVASIAALALIWAVVAVAFGLERQRNGAVKFPTPTAAQAMLFISWCPLLIFEAGFNAHPEVLAVAFLSSALLLRMRQQRTACGIVCGLAVAAKILAFPLVPFILGRDPKAWLFFGGALAGLYAPFWVQGSAADFAGLMTFAKEWEYNSSFFALARWGLGAPGAKVLCGLLFLTAWLLLFSGWKKRMAKSLSEGAVPPGVQVYGALFLFSATVNPWYLLWLAPFVAWQPSVAGITALALVSLSYVTGLNLGEPGLDNFAHPGWVRLVEYGGIGLAIGVTLWREQTQALVRLRASTPS